MAVVGSAYVEIHAVTTKLAGQVRDALRGATQNIGDAIGQRVGDEFSDSFSRTASSGMRRSRRMFEDEGSRAGSAFGGAFDKRLKRLAANFKPITIPIPVIAGGDVLVAGMTQLLGVVTQVAGGLTAMVGTIGQATGALATVPTFAAAAALGVGTFRLATMGLSDAIEALVTGSEDAAEKLAALPPAAQAFAREVAGLNPKLEELREIAASNMFPGMTAGLRAVIPLYPILRDGVASAATSIGELASRVGHLIGGPLSGEFATVVQSAATILDTLVSAGVQAANIITRIAAAAAPVAVIMAQDFATAMDQAGAAVARLAASGQLTNMFSESYEALKLLMSVLRNLGVTLFNVFRAGSDAGRELWTSLEGVTQRWRDFTGSVEGQNQLKAWFDNVVPTVKEFGRLIADVSIALANFAQLPGNEELVRQIRTELLPAVVSLFTTLAQSGIFEKFIDLLANAAGVMDQFAGSSGLASGIIDTFNVALSIINTLLQIPGLGNLLLMATYLAGVGFAMKTVGGLALGLGGNIKIVTDALTFMGTAATTSGRAAIVAKTQDAIAWVQLRAEATKTAAITAASWVKMGAAASGAAIKTAAAATSMKIVRGATVAWTGVQWALNAALLANPIGLIVAGIAALIAAIVAVVVYWDEITAAVSTAWDAIKGFGSWLGEFFSGLGSTIASGASAAWNWLVTTAQEAGSKVLSWLAELPFKIAQGLGMLAGMLVRLAIDAWTGLVSTSISVATGIITWVTGLPGRIMTALGNLATSLISSSSAAWDGFVSTAISVGLGIITWVQELPGKILSFLVALPGNLRTTGSNALSAMLTGITTGGIAVFQWFMGLPGMILSALAGAATWLLGLGTDIVTGLWTGLQNAWNGLITFIGGLITSFLDGFKQGLGIASPSTVFMQFGMDIIQGLLNGLQALASMVWTFITNLGTTLLTYFQAALSALTTLFTTVWTGIQAVFQAVWTFIQNVAITVWTAIAAFFTAGFNNFVANFTMIWNLVQATFQAVWTFIQNIAITVWTAISTFFTNAFNVFRALFQAVWLAIQIYFQTVWMAIQTLATTIWNAISAFFTAAFAAFQALFTTVWNAVRTIFTTVWNAIQAAAVAIWNAIAAFFSGAFAAFQAAFNAVWNAIAAIFSAVWNGIRAAATAIWNGISSFFTGAFNGFRSFFSTVWNDVSGIFSRVWEGIRSVASSIWQGIESTFRNGINAIIGGVNWLVNQVNKVLGFLNIPQIPTVATLARGGVLGPQMLASGGALGGGDAYKPIGPGFKTNGPRAIVGEGRRAYPEYVIPTDPKYRRRALTLFESLGGKLMQEGGVLDWIGDKASAAWGGITSVASSIGGAIADVAQWVGDGANALLEKALDAMRSMIPAGMFQDTGVGVVKKSWDAIKKMIQDAFTTTGGPLGGAAGGAGWQWQMAVLRKAFPGLQLISGFRPGAITATGNPSYHGKGRAVDVPPRMDVFNFIRGTYGANTKELIFSPAGGAQIWNGRPHMYTGITRANHWDHVHWAFDQGGWLPPGVSRVMNRTGKPEAVIPDPITALRRVMMDVFSKLAPELREALEEREAPKIEFKEIISQQAVERIRDARLGTMRSSMLARSEGDPRAIAQALTTSPGRIREAMRTGQAIVAPDGGDGRRGLVSRVMEFTEGAFQVNINGNADSVTVEELRKTLRAWGEEILHEYEGRT